jgi:hypothetical protein
MRMIELLEKTKPEHYSDYEGLHSCETLLRPDQPCDCGAAALIEEIDAMIKELQKEMEHEATL